MNAFKKITTYTLLSLACCLGFSACSDYDDPKPEPTNKLILTATPAVIKSGEEVTFTVTNEGVDVTAKAQVLSLDEGSKVITGKWSSSKPGVYKFTAIYNGRASAVSSVKVASGIVTGNYKRRVLAVDFTGTACSACPGMTRMLNNAVKNMPDRIVIMAAHVNVPSPDPLTMADGERLFASLGLNSAPNVWVDYRETPLATNPTTFKAYVARSLNEYPPICGAKISSTVAAGKVTANVAVRFSEGGNFKICAALLEDNVEVPQSVEGTYNHVLRAFATSASGDALGACVAGQEVTKTFEFPAGVWNAENCHVVIYLLNEATPGQYYVNNVRDCAANASVDFDYEIE
ncbi:MAG: Omp28-related outer membrane protein [Alistipes sp.]